MFNYYPLVGRVLRMIDPEKAHGLTIRALKSGMVPRQPQITDAVLQSRLWDMDFPNPVGLAAGFDKNAEVPDAVLGLGFGFVEIGSVTPLAQPGNPKPRMFRLTEDRGVINRMGFNNEGMDFVAAQLAARPRTGIVGANLGKNKTTEDAAADYELGAAKLGPLADYVVINVSSPNTPGLRSLQSRDQLETLVARTRTALDGATVGKKRPPLLLKIAPDLNEEDLIDIAAVALGGALDGLIVSNTTIARFDWLESIHKGETGGLSGKPVFDLSTAVLGRMYQLTEGKLPLVGVGGIASAADAYAKIKNGASLVQLYSALVYEGPSLVTRINRELSYMLRRDGFANVSEAVGAAFRKA